MIKFKVIFPSSTVDFLDPTEAMAFKNTYGGLTVVQYQEEEPITPLMDREIANWRLRSILMQRNLLDQVTALINGLPEPVKSIAVNAWDYGNTTQINSNTVRYLQASLGLSIADVVQIFDDADNIAI